MTHKLIDRRHLVGQCLDSALPSEAAAHAMTLYDHEFASSDPFSLADYCQRLSQVLPDFPLPRETRLTLLRELRQLDRVPTSPPHFDSEVA